MSAVVRRLDLSVRPQIDAESILWELLSRDYPSDEFANVTIQSEMGLDTSLLSLTGEVILYSVAAPVPYTSNKSAGVWRFSATLSIFSPDADTSFALAADLCRRVAEWPYESATPHGKVGSSSTSGFHRVAASKENGGKTIKEYAGDIVLIARDTFTK